ncbi:MAG: PAS domain S-box protein, partial [Candidatus Kapabacteria bacterium]|nr:PAS domain S-box protein [Candidatus Kapabacteria bacterium]MDW8225892.1 PAS domain S-box protein [Bacteroidota bacterium]
MEVDIRILISASHERFVQRLRALCRNAGYTHLHTAPLSQLPSLLDQPWDALLMGIRAEDIPLRQDVCQRLTGLPVILACTPEVAEQCTEAFQHFSAAGVLVEPITPQQLRAVVRLARQRVRQLQRFAAESHWLWDILSSIGDALIVTDPDGKLQYLNPAAERLTGWTLEESRQRPLEDILPVIDKETRQLGENPLRRALCEGNATGLSDHIPLLRRTGEEIVVEDKSTPIRDSSGHIRGAVLVLRNVTEPHRLQHRHQSALALRQKLLQLLQSLLELRPPEELLSNAVQELASLLPLELACLYIQEEDHLVARWHITSSARVEPLITNPIPVGSSVLGSILQRGVPEVVNNAHTDPRTFYPKDFAPTTPEHLIGIPMRIGQQHAILALARYTELPFSEEEVEVVLLFARFVHIGLLNAELWESLRRSEAQYRALLEWLPTPLIVHRERRILYANHAAAQYLGFQSPQEMLGRSPLELVAPEDHEPVLQRIQALYRGDSPTAPPRRTTLVRQDGTRLDAIVAGTLASYEGKQAVLVVAMDITEQQRLQQQREREHAAFHIVATAALQSQTIQELCQYFLTEACRELGFSGGTIRLLEGDLLVPVALTGPLPPECFPVVPISDTSALFVDVARSRQPIFIPNRSKYPLPEQYRTRLEELGIQAALSYPIIGKQGSLLGTFQLFHLTPMDIGESTHTFFAVLASALGVAIERLQFQERLQESEHRFRMLAEHAPVAITRFSLREGRYLFA